eukprot:CAMPEP_0180825704 /NCGR_PEP_ID=MMETSP1038_2-20121128/73126_1 /TAXON_ID=632150 /ORGANISM="Azadinium spinosum, Strain 3D9" /LENGTH=55 /DNA_ID=CAMNT_0022868211 /DNA_START=1 /DNA_END=165 /DNA_ORIENTATION=+
MESDNYRDGSCIWADEGGIVWDVRCYDELYSSSCGDCYGRIGDGANSDRPSTSSE